MPLPEADNSAEPEQPTSQRIRQDARRYVDALAARLTELEELAEAATRFAVFDAAEYAAFKRLFLRFSTLCEEFQVFSRITEDVLSNFQFAMAQDQVEREFLDDAFRRLQVPMLHAVIRTNLGLLRVWEDRVQRGEGLPIGSHELLAETARIIQHTRGELLRPRYAELVDEAALEDAAQADRILKGLIAQAPRLFDFASDGLSSQALSVIAKRLAVAQAAGGSVITKPVTGDTSKTDR